MSLLLDALRRTEDSKHGPAPRAPAAPASRLELEPLLIPPRSTPATGSAPDDTELAPPRGPAPAPRPPHRALIVGLAGGATALGALAIGLWFEMRPLALPERPLPRAAAKVALPPESAPQHQPAPPSSTAESPDLPAPLGHPVRASRATAHSPQNKGLPQAPQPDTAIRLHPGGSTSTASTTYLAHAAYLNNDFHQAELLYREALQADPEDVDALRGLGSTLARQQRWAEAGHTYSHARSLAPDDPDLSYNLAVTFDRAGQPGAAATHYRQALALATRSPAGFNPTEGAARLRPLAPQEPSP